MRHHKEVWKWKFNSIFISIQLPEMNGSLRVKWLFILNLKEMIGRLFVDYKKGSSSSHEVHIVIDRELCDCCNCFLTWSIKWCYMSILNYGRIRPFDTSSVNLSWRRPLWKSLSTSKVVNIRFCYAKRWSFKN